MRENLVRFQVYLPRSTYERLQQRAAQHALTLATQVRAALDDYLERAESQRLMTASCMPTIPFSR